MTRPPFIFLAAATLPWFVALPVFAQSTLPAPADSTRVTAPPVSTTQGSASVAPPPPSASVPAQLAQDTTNTQRLGPADPSLSSAVALPNTAAVFRASKDNNAAEVQFALNVPVGGPDFELYLAAKASTPVTAGTKATTLATLDGLATSSTLQLSVTPIYWNIKAPDEKLETAVCEKWLNKPSCARGDLPNAEAKAAFDQAVDYGVPVFGTIAVQIGNQSFTYDDPATLASQTVTRVPVALNASLGAFFPVFGYLGATYRHQVAYAAGASTTLCQPYAVMGTTTCDSVALAAPTREESNLLRLEARWFTRQFAVNPTVTYDLNQNVWGVDVPIYFITSTSSALIGGLEPGWRSDTNAVSVVAFVGAALSVAPGF